MYSKHIENAIALHPRHRAELTAAMHRADTLERAIRLIKAVCERCAIGEFPNPFPRCDERDDGFADRGLWFAIWHGWERGMERTKAEWNMMRDHMAYEGPVAPATELPPSPAPPPEPETTTLRRPDWSNKTIFPNKEAIYTWVYNVLGVSLGTKKLTREAMIEEANRLIKAKQREGGLK